MRIKPFINVNFCYKCGCPVPRVCVSVQTNVGKVSASKPFICNKCKAKKKNKKR